MILELLEDSQGNFLFTQPSAYAPIAGVLIFGEDFFIVLSRTVLSFLFSVTGSLSGTSGFCRVVACSSKIFLRTLSWCIYTQYLNTRYNPQKPVSPPMADRNMITVLDIVESCLDTMVVIELPKVKACVCNVDGDVLGLKVGLFCGAREGAVEGLLLGQLLGCRLGAALGRVVGVTVGCSVDGCVGPLVGDVVGLLVGGVVGFTVSSTVGL